MGSKKKAALHGVTKKDRAKLERRAAELEAEIERREKKAAKKALANSTRIVEEEKAAKKKAKKKAKAAAAKPSKKIDRSKVKKAKAAKSDDVGPIGVDETMTITAEAEAPVEPGAPSDVDEPAAERHPHLVHLDRVGELAAIVDDETAKPAAKKKAAAELAKLRAEGEALNAAKDAGEYDVKAGKARVAAARAERVGLPDPATIDRADAEAVRAYNAEAVKHGLTLLTSDAEREKIHARLTDAEAVAVEKVAEAVDAIGDAIEAFESSSVTGTIYAGGPSVATEPEEPVFAKPSEAPKSDFDSNGLGQYLVMRPSDGKLVGYTRVTSYIRGIEDDSGIVKWKLRVLLEGIAAAEEMGTAATAAVRDLTHNRDLAIAKARKADRKGKLATGELATYIEGAWRDFKRALDKLADELFEIGGGREKAAKGTDLHALFELHDTEGMQAVADLATLGQITPADLADVEAYAELVSSWGIDFVDVERVVVNDAVAAPTPSKPGRVIGVAGRLDRTGYVKLPGETRRRKRVIDVKTGSLEYSKAEISRQLASYAMSVGYDLDTHEREDLKLDQKTAVVIHLPAGSAKAELWAVDLVAGRKGLKIIADIRANRNEGKGAMTLVEHETSVD